MPFIRKSLLELVFSGAFMKRWNDKLRPMELVEVDKQAHKMLTAWVLFCLSSRAMGLEERLVLGEQIVEGGLFEYLHRLVITDIKPPVYYRIKANRDDYRRLIEWAIGKLAPRIAPLGDDFAERMRAWLLDGEESTLARRILNAAHLYASYSEFKVIRGLNPDGFEMQEIGQSFEDRLGLLSDLPGVSELLDPASVLGRFAATCGYLRFQKRWSQTPRVPETTVLGHMFIVACFVWFFSQEVGACRARRQNNFFAGLVHDLPELLTRDIISPVKSSAPEIADLIKQYEQRELECIILSPLRGGGYEDIADRLAYFLGLEAGCEFQPTICRDGRVEVVDDERLSGAFNRDTFDPKDGELLKMCDRLAAFIEANTALKNGISSDQLFQGCFRIRQFYDEHPEVAGIHASALLADFD